MMDKKITCDWIDRYNEGDLQEDEKELFRKLISENPLLHYEVRLDASLERFLQDDGVLDLMKKVGAVYRKKEKTGKRKGFLLMAAAMLCIMASGAILYLVRDKNSGPGMSANFHTERVQKKQEQVLVPRDHGIFRNPVETTWLPIYRATHHVFLADNYRPLAEIELLVGSVTRSQWLKMISPPVRSVIRHGTDVVFNWEAGNDHAAVNIVILNNKGVTVSDTSILDEGRFVLHTNGLTGGLYYWKVITEENLAFMGKFTIIRE